MPPILRLPRYVGSAAAIHACFLLPLSVARAQTPATAPTPLETRHTVRAIARGVDLIQEITPDGADGGPLIVTVIRIDPRVPGVQVRAALGQDKVWGTDPTFGREIVSRLAARHGAVAGINAGFFPFAGNPIGLHVQSGDMVTEPTKNRTSFYVSRNGTFGFEAFRYSGHVQTTPGGETFALDGLNRKPGKDSELLLFTPIFSPKTLRASQRVEAILSGIRSPLQAGRSYTGTVTGLNDGDGGGATAIAPGTVVLSGGGSAAEFLRRAAPVGAKLTFRLDTPTVGDGHRLDPATIEDAVTGGPRLLTDGKVTINLAQEGMGAAFSTTRHPRTAVGRTRDGVLLLMTVDGRQKGLSRGASLPEMADLLLKFGAVDAVNMDGGGSSAAIVWDAVASSPSEGVERPVADALLVYARPLDYGHTLERDKQALYGTLNAPSRPLAVGESWPFAGPSDGSMIRSDDSRAVWGTHGGVGFVDQSGLFHALRPGKGQVFATFGDRGRRLSASFTVVGKTQGDTSGFTPTLTLENTALVVRIANAEGDPLSGEPLSLTVTGGKADRDTAVTDAKGTARFEITWDKSATTRTIIVTSPQKRFRSGTLDAPTKPGS